MMFKEARSILIFLFICGAGSLALWHVYYSRVALSAGILLTVLLVFTVFFFRNPRRTIPAGENDVLAPADGRIIGIEEVREDTYLKETVTKVSIFLSVFNVHVNRIPVDGTVEYQQYTPGKFAAAFKDCASTSNENNAVGLKNDRIRILFKQISGLIARRIVSYLNVGDEVKKGALYGMIKFGSRTEIFLPKNVKVLVSVGDKVKAGETILGEIQ